jgi:hypothetical protein
MASDVYPQPITQRIQTILSHFHDLLHQTESLSSLLQHPFIGKREANKILYFLTTINNNAFIILAHLKKFEIHNDIELPQFTALLSSISIFHDSLWHQLTYPHAAAVRDHL